MDIPINVYIHSTHVDIKADRNGYIGVKGGHIKYAIRKFTIDKYDPDPNIKKPKIVSITRYYHYDDKEQRYRFPRYALPYLEECFKYMKNGNIPVYLNKIYVDSVLPRKVDFHMKNWVKDRPGQAEAIEYLSLDKPMLACEAGTGFGKTTVSIKTAILKKVPFLVICDGLTDQWVDNILEKTDMDGTDVTIVKEGKSLVKIFKYFNYGVIPSAIICSIQTVRNYIHHHIYPYNELPTWEEFLEKLGIGLIIKDEYHLNFKSYILVDLFSNVRNNIYLSATPRRNDKDEAKLFNKIYPPEILSDRTNSRKHVNIDLCGYEILIDGKEDRFKTKYGYSQGRYETYLLNNLGKLDEYFRTIENVVGPEFFNKYIPGEAKCVIFCYLKSMCRCLMSYLQTKYSNYDIKTKLSEDPKSNINADVIISTIGGLGTGHDISKLVTIVNTVSTRARTKLEQVPGRLRPVPGYQCKYVDIYNRNMYLHRNHLYIKRSIYRKLANKFREMYI